MKTAMMKRNGKNSRSTSSRDVVLALVPVTATLWLSRRADSELLFSAVGIWEV